MSAEVGYRLAPQQERVADALARRAPGHEALSALGSGGGFRVQWLLRLHAPLTLETLAARLCRAIDRHDALRLRLVPRPGARRPLQRFVAEGSQDPLAEGILRSAREDAREVCRAEWARPFDLTTEAPLRLVRLEEGPDASRLILTASALALDTRSSIALAEELCGDVSPLDEDPEALDWLGASAYFREWLEDEADEDARADRAHFSDASCGEPLRWPPLAVRPEHGAQGGGYVRLPVPVSREAASNLAAAAMRAEVSTEALWLAGLHALLARTSETTETGVRVASGGRGLEELETLLGPLSRWLPVGTRVDQKASAAALARSLDRALERAREHAHGHRDPDPSTDETSLELDAIAFAAVDATLEGAAEIEGLRAVETDAPLLATLLDAGNGSPEPALEVDTGRVDIGAAATFAAALADLWTSIANDPERAVGEHTLVAPGSARERALGGPYTSFEATPGSFVERFDAAVASGPEHPAVITDTTTLSYADLDRRSRALAAKLRSAGAGPDRPVALVLHRTHHALIAMLGAMRAGAPFLPLDPVLPTEAIGFRLEDADAAVVLTEPLLYARVPEPCPRWNLEELDLDAEPEPEVRGPAPADCAYLLYTSGSTGKPKAVAVEHRQLAAYIAAIEPRIGVGAGACWGNLSTLAADLGHTTLFPALATGGTLRLFGEESMGNARVLAEQLRACPIDVLKIVPSHLAALLDGAGGPEAERALLPAQALLCGGEPLPSALVERIGDAVPTLLNHYGPTETTVGVVVGDARSMPSDAEGRVPIGHPLGHARAYVLDERLAPVPVGVPGELYVAGPTVTRGYAGRPALTAERFLPDPFGPEPGARMYRTGDRVRRLADGSLAYLGRTDFQVKIRGFRVEPGEIEKTILDHPDVAQAAVKALGDATSGGARLVAWVAPRTGVSLEAADLREWMKSHIAVYMRPASWVLLRALPLTPNGKVDRAGLPEPDTSQPATEHAYVAPRGAAERDIAAIWCELLGLERVGVEDNFFDLGGHSLLLVQLMSRLEARFEREILITELFQYTTVAAMADWLDGAGGASTAASDDRARRERRFDPNEPIAVVGMAARFPGAGSIDAFWENLREGRDGVTRLERDALLDAGVDASLLDDPHFVPASPMLDDIDRFDATFFGVAPRQAQIMDPQHRLLLEIAWAALEDAGIAPGRSAGRVGVFAGAGLSSYFLHNLAAAPELVAAAGVTAVRHANRVDNLATRVAYHLDLAGPAVTVQSGCSSSLVAVHLAAQSLLTGDSDVAIAGGVTVNAGQGRGYLHQPGGINAPDGRCRAFDAAAAGTVFGSGVGAVVLKRLSDALADGDTVHAVVLGSAMNNDGAIKQGYTAPSIEGQATVVADALARAGVDPADVDFVEAHGTGTAIGDPIEVAALARAFGSAAAASGSTVLGSVKSNLGHLDAAAGIAGFLKAVLALSRGEIPPTLHFEAPNPRLQLDATPFRIAEALTPLEGPPEQRRGGVSSFGIGGTNVHVVLGGPVPAPRPDPAPASANDGAAVLTLSARRADALDGMAEALAERLRAQPELALDDVAWTLANGRRPAPHRRTVLCADREEAIQALSGALPDRVRSRVATLRDADIAFLFPGQGAQMPGMAAPLYEADAAFRYRFDEVQKAVEEAQAQVGHPSPGELRELLLNPQAPDAAKRLADTALAQPALFVIELAMVEAWAARGVRASALVGHSLGEWVAATHAGVFSLEDGARLVALRGQLLAQQPTGAMLAVRASAEDVGYWLAEPGGEGLHLSAINGGEDVTVGGSVDAIETFAARLARGDVQVRRLATSHAFHVPQMEGAVEPFRAAVAAVPRQAPQVPFVSARTGGWIQDAEAVDPDHWAQQLVEPVRFSEALAALGERFGGVALEVGPGRALSTLVRRETSLPVVAPRPGGSPPHPISAALADLWLHGAAIDWSQALPGGTARRVSLPTYPFARERHWVDATPGSARVQPAVARVGGEAAPAEGFVPAIPEDGDASTDLASVARASAYRAPRTDPERLLVDIWEQVLGVPKIGVDDDFFELGGDSLQVLQVLSLVREAGYALDPEDLFDRQTVATVVEVMHPAASSDPRVSALGAERLADPVTGEDVGFTRRPRRVVPWTAEQRRWLAAGGAPVHQRLVSAVDGNALPDEDGLRAATVLCTARYGALRLRAARAGGEWIQRLVSSEDAPWTVATRTLASGESLESTLAALARELDPVAGPVAAAVRLACGGSPEATRLAVIVHPLVADADALDVLVSELLNAGAASGARSPDPEAEGFGSFAESALLASLDAPTEASGGAPVRVPRDFPLGEALASNRVRATRPVANVAEGLEGVLAATACALHRWTGVGRVDLAFERRAAAASESVGCFTERATATFEAAADGVSVEDAREAMARAVVVTDSGAASDVWVRVTSPPRAPEHEGTRCDRIPGPAPWTHPEARPLHALEVTWIAGDAGAPGQLAVDYSSAVHRSETVDRVIDDITAQLTGGAEGATPEEAPAVAAPALTPDAVSATSIRPADLEKLLARVGGSDAQDEGER
ncbi:MAG: amino acid adenylation domain-containing protein [Myxococcota bacterium]